MLCRRFKSQLTNKPKNFRPVPTFFTLLLLHLDYSFRPPTLRAHTVRRTDRHDTRTLFKSVPYPPHISRKADKPRNIQGPPPHRRQKQEKQTRNRKTGEDSISQKWDDLPCSVHLSHLSGNWVPPRARGISSKYRFAQPPGLS